ncbi:serine hydrolase domain-containing protein [Amycolatopsis sp., V23-08]|uniref:Serine hydrolase domain-containing protein n=1 Tax=Amycolatopsis heterodermiae TaxID=3110235 RepID=A0ABU5RH42_9PSEU|nr:serine hydrolase domain-containing protein [Amycolatopsis sp., V23-08]MEA5365084.1 serine hydrolase domain-containing protein [Amycolatopsis sp., V23-08]
MIDWTEPGDPALERSVAELVRARGARASLCVLRDGRVLLDRSFGVPADALFWIFSASKPFVALLVHQLAVRGALSLDAPVAEYWPEFARGGKGAITVRHVLRHRSGFASARGFAGDALTMTDWARTVRAIERVTPRWAPGEVAAYQPIVYGHLLGEVVRRVTGEDVDVLLRKEFLGPLGLADTHLGLPDELWPRHVPLRGRDAGARLTARMVNRRAVRRAVIPAAGVSTTARDLATFYQALLDGDVVDAVAVREARRPSGDAVVDRTIRTRIRWAQGFQLGGVGRPMGTLSGRETFGHNGSNCCVAWADPARGLVFAYLTDRVVSGHSAAAHLGAVADAVLTAGP